MARENEITVKLKVSGSINIPDHILDKIADGFKWIEDAINKPGIIISNALEDESLDFSSKSAEEHASAVLTQRNLLRLSC